jgi:hypothetical protein
MTSIKEKAEELIYKFEILLNYDLVSNIEWKIPADKVRKDAKKCALAAIDLIIEQNNLWIMQTGKGTNNYWKEVKKEVEKF